MLLFRSSFDENVLNYGFHFFSRVNHLYRERELGFDPWLSYRRYTGYQFSLDLWARCLRGLWFLGSIATIGHGFLNCEVRGEKY